MRSLLAIFTLFLLATSASAQEMSPRCITDIESHTDMDMLLLAIDADCDGKAEKSEVIYYYDKYAEDAKFKIAQVITEIDRRVFFLNGQKKEQQDTADAMTRGAEAARSDGLKSLELDYLIKSLAANNKVQAVNYQIMFRTYDLILLNQVLVIIGLNQQSAAYKEINKNLDQMTKKRVRLFWWRR